jgi:2'-5' RNA ligase
MIFPRFHNLEKIQEIRRIYDPLYAHVASHITLVFPFRGLIPSRKIEEHVRKSVENMRPFKIVMQGISKEAGNYLFLNISEGNESIVELHRRLYSGLLSELYPSFLRANPYKPHMTLGRTSNPMELEIAYNKYKDFEEKFSDTVTEVAVEIIDEFENSEIELTVGLGGY